MGKLPQQKFRLAVDRHYKLVYQVAAGMLGDAAEAQDVTQETFTQYWQHGADAEHTKAWLIRVARNRCLDRLRRRHRIEYREPEALPEAVNSHDSLAVAELDELTERLRCAVDSLPEPQRSIVLLFSLQGMSGKDCAETLGISVNQVKVYLHRARARLRTLMELPALAEKEIKHG
ncbi:MAG TPA: sigma-70 family RNA polymerase sigma factor [Gammaproteobacteria bacterium]|nr:sigma-70 family RNA polymerase sigma factor [Gammaproteobacteria bacterium]